MSELWLTTIPIKNESPDTVYEKLKEPVELGRSQARIHRIIIPDLVVGTLDTLMTLAEDLIKHCNQVEQILRKIERQYIEISGSSKISLNVNNKSVEEFLRKFEWDFARYQHQNRPLSEIITQILSSTAKADDELKKIASLYNEKQSAYNSLQRRKIINMSLSDFEDFLTPDEAARIELLDSDSLLTVAAAIPIAIEADFLKKYMLIGNDIASLGSIDFESKGIIPGSNSHVFGKAGRDTRDSIKGSPVIPNSAIKLKK
jgi:V-type H+-transporting ATPase subunit C